MNIAEEFESLFVSKAFSWGEVEKEGHINWKLLSSEVQTAILDLPEVAAAEFPCDVNNGYYPRSIHPVTDDGRYTLFRTIKGDKCYIVDTQGYLYARYAFYVENFDQ